MSQFGRMEEIFTDGAVSSFEEEKMPERDLPVILASGSPRRKELLELAGIEFEIDVADVDEKFRTEDPELYVREISYRKASKVAARHPGRIVLAADTTVVLDGSILGKPLDEKDALYMLKQLSGRTHQVFTGVTIMSFGEGAGGSSSMSWGQSDLSGIPHESFHNTFSECTHVTMYENDEKMLERYIATGEPMDKAGAYGIQGKGSLLVKKIWGDYYNVVGLPIARVVRELGAVLMW